jgi:hypothetical protein
MHRFLLDAIDSDRPRCRRIFGSEHLVGGQELEDRHVDGDPEILDLLVHIQGVEGLQIAEQLDESDARSVTMGTPGTPAPAASIGTTAVIDISPRIEERRRPPAPSRIYYRDGTSTPGPTAPLSPLSGSSDGLTRLVINAVQLE